jgi:hypothetical protein
MLISVVTVEIDIIVKELLLWGACVAVTLLEGGVAFGITSASTEINFCAKHYHVSSF